MSATSASLSSMHRVSVRFRDVRKFEMDVASVLHSVAAPGSTALPPACLRHGSCQPPTSNDQHPPLTLRLLVGSTAHQGFSPRTIRNNQHIISFITTPHARSPDNTFATSRSSNPISSNPELHQPSAASTIAVPTPIAIRQQLPGMPPIKAALNAINNHISRTTLLQGPTREDSLITASPFLIPTFRHYPRLRKRLPHPPLSSPPFPEHP